MAQANSHNLRMPPDSTGKRVKLSYYVEIPYSGMSTTSPNKLEVDDHCRVARGGVSQFHGFIVFVNDNGDGTGLIGLRPHTNTQTPFTGAIAGDTIDRNENGSYTQRATVSNVDVPIYVNSTQLVSHDNPTYGQKVDQYGAAFARFTEGGVTFDGSGRMRQTNNITIMSNEFHDLLPYHFSTTIDSMSHGSVTHNNSMMCAVLSTPGDNTGLSGPYGYQYADIVADKYLFHEANAALFVDMSVRIGDSGKAGVIREWGLQNYQHDQGVYFRLDGTTLSAVLSNKASGSTVETVVNASDWSQDTAGKGTSNPSGFKLDLTKVNSYWIELMQDGAGIVKMGIFNEDNVRVLCHVFSGNNSFSEAFLSSGSYPFHFHQKDTTNDLVASSMFVYAVSAELEGPTSNIVGTFYEGCSDPLTVSSTATWTPLFSIRPKVFEDQVSKTCVTATGTVVTLDSATSVTTGMRVQCQSSSFISPYTVVTSITGNDVHLNRPILADISGKSINFGFSVNHNLVMPKLISLDVCDEVDRITPRRIKLEVFRDTVLTGDVWAKTKGTSQTDYKATLGDGFGATAQSGGTAIGEWIVRGQADLDIGALFDYSNTYLVNKANGLDQHQLTIAAKALDPGVSVNIVCALTWEEIESH